MESKTIDAISERLYSLFVINTTSIACQLRNGSYRRREVPVSPALIKAMLVSNGSMGCYQQQPYSGYVRWICLDYDCSDKDAPDVLTLYREVVAPLSSLLESLSIEHLLEFSGRRGIHVWVVFDEAIPKAMAYRILTSIEGRFEAMAGALDPRWHLDRFPATTSAKNNIVGKQVKLPLSCHRAGGRSFCFECERDLSVGMSQGTSASQDFFAWQLRILSSYAENRPRVVMDSLNLAENSYGSFRMMFGARQYRVLSISELGNAELTVDQLITTLSRVNLYATIFERLRRGTADARDRSVLFGTLAGFEEGVELLRSILSRYPHFDEDKTEMGVSRLKDRYRPASFGYLYEQYGLSLDDGLEPSETGVTYVLRAMGKEDLLVELPPEHVVRGEGTWLVATADCIADVVDREKNYLCSNDEARDVCILADLESLGPYECNRIALEAKGVSDGEGHGDALVPSGYRVFERQEQDGKVRELVSLSAHDRVLTTYLALRLCSLRLRGWDSFSYHVALTSRSSIFFSWLSSWSRYLRQIRAFLDVGFFADYEIFVLDLEGFYDHVDFLGVYRVLGSRLDGECRNIFEYLVGFNDEIMCQLHDGLRVGIPQGPAYARIVAELFLDEVLRQSLADEDMSKVYRYRYVDDMVFICEPGYDSEGLFDRLSTALRSFGLPVNSKKSHCYGTIGSITLEARSKILHDGNFNYQIHERDDGMVLLARDKRVMLRSYLDEHEELFDVSLLGYYFGTRVIEPAKERFFADYHADVVTSKAGRGSHFAHFYQYAFSSDERIGTIVESGELADMPVGTVNFSNFVNELYLAWKDGNETVARSLDEIVDVLLEDVDVTELDVHDRTVVRALCLLSEDLRGTGDVDA